MPTYQKIMLIRFVTYQALSMKHIPSFFWSVHRGSYPRIINIHCIYRIPPAIRKPDCRTDSNPFLYSIHWSICFLLYWSIAHCNGRSVEGAVEYCRISGRSVY